MRAEDWISVKERLPESADSINTLVWAWDKYYEQGHETFYTMVRGNPERWTHWQPFPLPPKDLTTNNLVGSELSIKETV